MTLSNSQYDAIVRGYRRQQIEDHHKLEERRQEIYARLPVVRQLEAGIVGRSVACVKELLGGNRSVLDRLKEDLKDLWEQKPPIIRATGYPDDYLELHYRCPDCRDTGLIDGRRCHCLLQVQIKLLHAQSNLKDIPERKNFSALSHKYYDDTEILSQLGITDAAYTRRVMAGYREFVRDFDKKHDSLLFTGDTGMGKALLTNRITRELTGDSHSVACLAVSDLFDVFSRNKFDYDNAEDMKDMYRFILDCDLLITDGLGTELNNSFTSSQLFYYTNEQVNMSRSIIIFTNLTLTRLRDSYTDRVTSRIMSGYRIISLCGGDVRLLKK